jgi:lipopolysaccharide/colanic/teichoic acid biosynthesis glycosyltransferase
MAFFGKREPIFLFVGDIILFYIALFITLFVRYGGFLGGSLLMRHIYAFSVLFLAWVIVYFVAGLYERHTIIFRSRLPFIILKVQIVNILLAVFFFYFIPYFTIAPKLNLFIYLCVSFILTLLWRIYGYPLLAPRRKQRAVLIGSGEGLRELEYEVNHNDLSGIRFVASFDVDVIAIGDLKKQIADRVRSEEVSIVAIDLTNAKVEPLLPELYKLVFRNVRFVSVHKLYEEIFKRVPLSLVHYNWFLENISSGSKPVFDSFKRVFDFLAAFITGLISLVFYPIVWLAIKLDDNGALFYTQYRVGKNNRVFKIYKFRSMADNKITSVGRFLRKTRFDELPQLWSVVIGHQSLIGPRPERPEYVKIYSQEIDYYNVRHLITPGLSGWAQIYHDNHPHFKPKVNDTMEKLSYDLYYINNRSFLLDLEIALKTLRILLSFKGK